MKYDDAIYEIEKIRNTGSFRDSQMEALDLAVEALQEKAEREKRCEYCNTVRIQSAIGFKQFKYCPLCGRKLGEK